jgi:hypothetical protein
MFAFQGWDSLLSDATDGDGNYQRQHQSSRIVDTLPQIYPRYDCDDMWRELLELLNLYRQLIAETAGLNFSLLGYEIDLSTAENIYAWAQKCYQAR